MVENFTKQSRKNKLSTSEMDEDSDSSDSRRSRSGDSSCSDLTDNSSCEFDSESYDLLSDVLNPGLPIPSLIAVCFDSCPEEVKEFITGVTEGLRLHPHLNEKDFSGHRVLLFKILEGLRDRYDNEEVVKESYAALTGCYILVTYDHMLRDGSTEIFRDKELLLQHYPQFSSHGNLHALLSVRNLIVAAFRTQSALRSMFASLDICVRLNGNQRIEAALCREIYDRVRSGVLNTSN